MAIAKHIASRAWPVTAALLLGTICAAALARQEPSAASATASAPFGELSIEDLQNRVRQIEQLKDLDKQARDKLHEHYTQAIDRLKAARAWAAKAALYEKNRLDVPAETERLKRELAQPAAEARIEAPADATVAQLQQSHAAAQKAFEAAKKTADEKEAEPKRRANRRISIPKEYSRIKDLTADIDQQSAAPGDPNDPAEAGRAARIRLEATKRALERQFEAYQNELAWYDAATELMVLQRDAAVRHRAAAEKVVKQWLKEVNDARQHEARRAEQQAREARNAAAKASPEVRRLAEENARLAEEANELTKLDNQLSDQILAAEKRVARTKADFVRIKERVAAAGQANIGLYLLKHRAELPDMRVYDDRIAARQADISRVQLRLLQMTDARSELVEMEQRIDEVVAQLDALPQNQTRLKPVVEDILREQRSRIDALNLKYEEYLRRLIDLNAKESELLHEARALAAYIDERVLWIRSNAPLSPADAAPAREALAWLTRPSHASDALRALYDDVLLNWHLAAPALLVFGGLLLARRPAIRRLTSNAQQAADVETDRFLLTLEVLGLTVLLALPGAGLVGFLGWRLGHTLEAAGIARSVGAGLLHVASALIAFELLRQVCRRKGLAEAHFRWRPANLRIFRRNLAWLMGVLLPLAFIRAAVRWQAQDAWTDSLARAAFMAGLIALSVFHYRILRRSGGVVEQMLVRHRGRALERLYPIWFPLAVAVPLVLAILAGLGFYYTAEQLEGLLFQTLMLIVAVFIVHALLMRWIFVAHRRLSVEQAHQRREAAEQVRERIHAPAHEQVLADGHAPPPSTADTGVDLLLVSEQTRKLLQAFVAFVIVAGGWLIWRDVLPTIGILKAETSWTRIDTIRKELPPDPGDPDGAVRHEIEDRTVPVTVGNLLLAVIVLIVTFVAARNIPGLLEISILRRLPFEVGGRYAITTISRYVITVAGVVIAFGLIGIGWTKVQWLVAAITVGLGFGLQEIFANFVSGLIILFERPVRVGDVVTVGDVSGTVSRIRIRATTIRDADRKELIVPNKRFITDQIVNWTLSDRVIRVVIRIGVPYGSDAALVQKLLVNVARQNSRLMSTPAPEAYFLGFGENAMNFELTVFVASPDVAGKTRNELNIAIIEAFREAGIELAPPAREMRLQTDEQPISVVVRRDRRGATRPPSPA